MIVNNPQIDFEKIYSTPFYEANNDHGDRVAEMVPCVPPACPQFQEFRIEPEPDWQELVNQSWRNHPVLRNVPEGFYPQTVRRQQVQGIVQIAQEFRKVRGLDPGVEVWIFPPEGTLREMVPIIEDLRAHGILVDGCLD